MTKQYTLPKGTICKINGIPFELAEDTVICMHEENWELMHELGREDQRCSYVPKGELVEQTKGQTDVQFVRDYLLPAELFKRVVELLGFAHEFAELKMLNLQLVSDEEDKQHGFPPALVVEAGGVTNRQGRIRQMAFHGLDEDGNPLKKD